MKRSFIGIDVSKPFLDVYIEQTNVYFRVSNTSQGIEKLFEEINKLRVIPIIVCEPTGGYERLLKEMCLSRQTDLHVAHPNKIRAFAQASGILAKTDKLDAKLICLFGSTFQLRPCRPTLSKEALHLRALCQRRQQLITEKNRETNRLEIPLEEFLTQSLKRHIEWLEAELKDIENAIDTHIESCSLLKQRVNLITSIPGVGLKTAITLLTELPEIGTISSESISALVGVAPYNRESGSWCGNRRIHAGRSAVRKALYMACVASLRSNKYLKEFYMRLKAKGKPSKVALIAVAHKILIILSSMLKNNLPYNPDHHTKTS